MMNDCLECILLAQSPTVPFRCQWKDDGCTNSDAISPEQPQDCIFIDGLKIQRQTETGNFTISFTVTGVHLSNVDTEVALEVPDILDLFYPMLIDDMKVKFALDPMSTGKVERNLHETYLQLNNKHFDRVVKIALDKKPEEGWSIVTIFLIVLGAVSVFLFGYLIWRFLCGQSFPKSKDSLTNQSDGT